MISFTCVMHSPKIFGELSNSKKIVIFFWHDCIDLDWLQCLFWSWVFLNHKLQWAFRHFVHTVGENKGSLAVPYNQWMLMCHKECCRESKSTIMSKKKYYFFWTGEAHLEFSASIYREIYDTCFCREWCKQKPTQTFC